jgi:pseudouridine synthase
LRLARYLARAGIASRRKSEELITGGRVKVNGVVITNVATNVDPEKDRVSVDGKAAHAEDLFYAVLNKPKGCITTVSDPWDRPTVMDYMLRLPAAVKPVGRLDFYSEGVLLVTNDGQLAAALLAPGNHVKKTYHVKLRGLITDHHIKKLRDGIVLDGRVTREAQVDRVATRSRHDWLVITLTEGRSRQIHRMLDALGYEVTKLQRVAFGTLTFHGMRVGDARELEQSEVNALRDLAGLPRSAEAVGRGKWSSRREESELARRAKARATAEADAKTQQPQDRARRKPRQRPKPAAKPAAKKPRQSSGGRRKRPKRGR